MEAVAGGGGGGGAGDDVRPGGGERRREAEGARERGSMLGAAAQSDSQEHAGNMIKSQSPLVSHKSPATPRHGRGVWLSRQVHRYIQRICCMKD